MKRSKFQQQCKMAANFSLLVTIFIHINLDSPTEEERATRYSEVPVGDIASLGRTLGTPTHSNKTKKKYPERKCCLFAFCVSFLTPSMHPLDILHKTRPLTQLRKIATCRLCPVIGRPVPDLQTLSARKLTTIQRTSYKIKDTIES